MQDQAGRTFDVLVVGSGASGGWAAKRLAEAGVKVGLLDAGRVLTDAVKRFSNWSERTPRRDASFATRVH
jgi:choline dehydrogenase-like flavoprotein